MSTINRGFMISLGFLILFLSNFSYAEIIAIGELDIISPGCCPGGAYESSQVEIDGRMYSEGTIEISIKLGTGVSSGSFDLFVLNDSDFKRIASRYDVSPNSETVFLQNFKRPEIFMLTGVGNWFSPRGSLNTASYRVLVRGNVQEECTLFNIDQGTNPGDMPELWDGWDTLHAADEIFEEVTQDKPLEAILKMSLDTIIEKMVREKNAEKLAKLEAVYKRKLLKYFQNKFGVLKDKKLPKISKKELKVLKEMYKYSPTITQRVSGLARMWKSLNTLYKSGVNNWIRSRVGKAITSKLFSKIFGPVTVLTDLHEIYKFVIETQALKESWLGALNMMEKMSCADYEIYVFRKNLTIEEQSKILELRIREAKFFEKYDGRPPIYPRWSQGVDP